MEWAILPFKRYFQFEGRSGRKEYWSFFLLTFVGVTAAALVDALVGGKGILSGLAYLAVAIPSLSVGVRRLHDTNRTGWWILLPFIPLVGAIVLLVFLTLKGDAGPNKYGSDPRAADPETAAEVFS